MTDFEIHGRIYSFNNWLEEGRILPGSCLFLREKSRRGREYIINGVDIMCGIVGYVGEEQAAPILLGGLSKLEYRGYDSAGIAVRNDETGRTEIVKAKGRLKILVEKTDGGMAVPGTCGIGHTRWATHGEPSESNAHPHCSDDRSVVLVHNGIIEKLSGT